MGFNFLDTRILPDLVVVAGLVSIVMRLYWLRRDLLMMALALPKRYLVGMALELLVLVTR